MARLLKDADALGPTVREIKLLALDDRLFEDDEDTDGDRVEVALKRSVPLAVPVGENERVPTALFDAPPDEENDDELQKLKLAVPLTVNDDVSDAESDGCEAEAVLDVLPHKLARSVAVTAAVVLPRALAVALPGDAVAVRETRGDPEIDTGRLAVREPLTLPVGERDGADEAESVLLAAVVTDPETVDDIKTETVICSLGLPEDDTETLALRVHSDTVGELLFTAVAESVAAGFEGDTVDDAATLLEPLPLKETLKKEGVPNKLAVPLTVKERLPVALAVAATACDPLALKQFEGVAAAEALTDASLVTDALPLALGSAETLPCSETDEQGDGMLEPETPWV